MWALTKCTLELSDISEWVVLFDVDEMCHSGEEGDAGTLAKVLQALPEDIHHFPFCTEVRRASACDGLDEEVAGVEHWRPKSAYRVGSGQPACEWFGTPHASTIVEKRKESVSCGPSDASGRPVDVFSLAEHAPHRHREETRLWSGFAPHCAPSPRYYFRHTITHVWCNNHTAGQ
jgi:hypothetical protein